MHHEAYDPEDVLAHTIELCIPCHRKADFEGYIRKDFSKHKAIKVSYETQRRLARLVVKGETYDSIIQKCIEAYKEEKRGGGEEEPKK
jgi:hypothetical protein